MIAPRQRRFVIRPVAPFRLDLTVWALRRRARNVIDRWDGETYRRVVQLGSTSTEIAVRQTGAPGEPRLTVVATPAPRGRAGLQHLRLVLDRLLGIHVDLSGWYQLAARDARLKPLAERFRGVKPPRFPTLFEALLNGVACQQLSLEVGLELLNRLAAAGRAKRRSDAGMQCGFPSPRALARLPLARYRALGFSRQKARAILELARTIEDSGLERLERESEEEIRGRLLALRGVGRWTAEYVLLRGLGRLDVFPGDDVGAQKRLARWLGRRQPLDYAGVNRVTRPWRPYAGMVYFHLLLDGLWQRRILQNGAQG